MKYLADTRYGGAVVELTEAERNALLHLYHTFQCDQVGFVGEPGQFFNMEAVLSSVHLFVNTAILSDQMAELLKQTHAAHAKPVGG